MKNTGEFGTTPGSDWEEYGSDTAAADTSAQWALAPFPKGVASTDPAGSSVERAGYKAMPVGHFSLVGERNRVVIQPTIPEAEPIDPKV